MKLIYSLGTPCQTYCLNPDIIKTYKVVTNVEDIPEKDKRYYSYCKWCGVFLRWPKPKRFCHCPCCGKATHKVMRQNSNGKWYDDY